MSNLRDIGEDALIEKLIALVPCPKAIHEGPGDDCAVVDTCPDSTRLQLLKTDAIVEGVHYLASTPARAVGWKAIARVISDFAAMGGKADRFLVTIAFPASTPVHRVEELYRGFADCLNAHGAVLAGGETTSIPEGSAVVISIAASGHVERDKLVLRSGGKPGNHLVVSGKLGGSIKGKHLSFKPRQKEAEWLVSNYKPMAMMDLSDGMARDLPRLAKASQCGFKLYPDALPLNDGCTVDQALHDGEDYEMLMAVDGDQKDCLIRDWNQQFPELPITVIGELVDIGHGQELSGGWEHFSQ